MREAIEKVVSEFQERLQLALKRLDYNAASDWEYAINRLEAVLANADSDTRNPSKPE